MGAILPQGKAGRGLPETPRGKEGSKEAGGRGEEGSSPSVFGGTAALPPARFLVSSFQNWENTFRFKSLVCGTLLWKRWES